MTIVGRSQIDHPALGTAGGSGLHASIETIYTNISNHLMGRFRTASAVANSAVTTFDHDLGIDFSDLNVMIYTGTYPALTRVADAVAAGWAIAATSGFAKTKIDVTAPASGGPHTFAVFIGQAVTFASANQSGFVSTTTQTFAGLKTFNDFVTFKAVAGTIAAGSYNTAGAWILGPAAGLGTTTGHSVYGPILGAVSSSVNQLSISGQDRAFIGNNIYRDSAAAAKRSLANAAGYSYLQVDRSVTSTDPVFSFVTNADTQTNGAAGASVTTNEKTIGFVTLAGAWTLGPASGSAAHTARGNNGDFNITATSATGVSGLYITAGTTSGAALVNYTTSNVSSRFVHGVDQANTYGYGANSFYWYTAATATSVGGITGSGAWTLGPSTGATGSTTLNDGVNGSLIFSGSVLAGFQNLNVGTAGLSIRGQANGNTTSAGGTKVTAAEITLYQTATNALGGYISFRTHDGSSVTEKGSTSSTGAWAFGTALGTSNVEHLFNTGLNATSTTIITARTSTAGNSTLTAMGCGNAASSHRIGFMYSRDGDTAWLHYNNGLNFLYNPSNTFTPGATPAGSTLQGSVSTAGVWTLGPTSAIGGSSYAGNNIVGKTNASSIGTGYVGEVVTNSATGVSLTTTQYNEAGTITLTPGVWDITGHVSFSPAATTSITRHEVGIGTTSGNSSAGLVTNENRSIVFQAAAVPGNDFGRLTPVWRVNISSSTTYYLKGRADFTVSTMTINGYIRATRIA